MEGRIDSKLVENPRMYYPLTAVFLWSTVVLTYYLLDRSVEEGVFNGFVFALAFTITHFLVKHDPLDIFQ